MSQLISNPQSESEPQPTGPSDHIAHDPGGWHHPGIVVRYDAATDLSDQPDDPIEPDEPDAGDLEDPQADSRPDSGSGAVGRIRAILAVLVHGLLALSWACLRAVYRYPRWALAIVLSVVILGATALTRPGKPTPRAVISQENPATSSSGSGGREDSKKDGKDPKEGSSAIADAGQVLATNKAEEKDKEPKKSGGASDAPRGREADGVPSPPAPKFVDASPANSAVAGGVPPKTDSRPADQESGPAPPPHADATDATLIAGTPAAQRPRPHRPRLLLRGPSHHLRHRSWTRHGRIKDSRPRRAPRPTCRRFPRRRRRLPAPVNRRNRALRHPSRK